MERNILPDLHVNLFNVYISKTEVNDWEVGFYVPSSIQDDFDNLT